MKLVNISQLACILLVAVVMVLIFGIILKTMQTTIVEHPKINQTWSECGCDDLCSDYALKWPILVIIVVLAVIIISFVLWWQAKKDTMGGII